MVVTDHMGVFFAGVSKTGGEVSSAEIAELMTVREAIIFTWEAGFRDVIFEGDNIIVMNAIRSNEIGLTSGGAIVVDVFQVGLSCNRVSFSFCKEREQLCGSLFGEVC